MFATLIKTVQPPVDKLGIAATFIGKIAVKVFCVIFYTFQIHPGSYVLRYIVLVWLSNRLRAEIKIYEWVLVDIA